MKAQSWNLLLIVGFFCCCGGCEEPPGAEVVYSISLKDLSENGFSFVAGYAYPDTLIPDEYNKIRGCPPNNKVRYDSKNDWDEVFSELPADTLSIFIFSEIVTEENWDDVRNNYTVAKRYDLSLEDLERLDWLVVYPPDDSMKDVKMYPR